MYSTFVIIFWSSVLVGCETLSPSKAVFRVCHQLDVVVCLCFVLIFVDVTAYCLFSSIN